MRFIRSAVSSSVSGRRLYSSVTIRGTSYPYIWLRDSCQCPQCIHPSTQQKLHRSSDIYASNPKPVGEPITSDNGVTINWSSGHKSFYTSEFLQRHATPANLTAYHQQNEASPATWTKATLSALDDLFVKYSSLESPSGLLVAINQLTRYGIIFISDVPTTSATPEVNNLVQYFGRIRSTMYGDTWNVKNIRNSRNIAYTDLDLGMHMDLLYFEQPPRFQILHCVRNRVEGGTSIFLDAFHAAHVLREIHPSAFHTLSTTPVPFQYINDGHHLFYEHPTIELAGSGSDADETIKSINYSPPFQAPLRVDKLSSSSTCTGVAKEDFFSSLHRFSTLLDDPANAYPYTLREGDAAIFDNRRVLHSRTAFHERPSAEGEGKPGEDAVNRWLQGCYFEPDTMLDRGRVLRTAFRASSAPTPGAV